MDKETLSNYGWIVVLVLVLAVMLALATPFGTFIAGAIKSTTAGLFNVNQAALGSAGIDVNDMVFENCDHLSTEIQNERDDYTGDIVCKDCGKVVTTGQNRTPVVPDGGQYTAADGTVYGPGEEMPEVVTTGDKYTYGDYEYGYNMYSDGSRRWTVNESQNGWCVDTISNDKTAYGDILANINGQPIVSLYRTFSSCSSLVIAPQLPATVTNMSYTFYYCNSLTTTAIIPSKVTTLHQAFINCKELKTYHGSTDPDGDFSNYILPEGLTELGGTFWGCKSMTHAPVLPSTLINMPSAFHTCTALQSEGLPVIPDGVKNMQNTFSECTSLTTLNNYTIPASVTDTGRLFAYCTSLTEVNNLDIRVTYYSVWETFDGCTSLKRINGLKISDTVTTLKHTFRNCSSLESINGFVFSTNVREWYETFIGCTSLTTAPDLSNCNRLSLNRTFSGCTSLRGTITINKNTSFTPEYFETFKGINFETQNLKLAGNTPNLDAIGSTGLHYCLDCNGKCDGTNGHTWSHAGGTATCTQLAVCATCGEEYGDLVPHAGGTATCTQLAVCATCGEEYGDLVPHAGGTATCTQQAICTVCNNEYGPLSNHNSHNGMCSICGADSPIESEHSPYSNNINNVVLGTWDYSDAQSVTITITYQTESISYDWIYLKSGDNYIDLNGSITTTETKIGGNTKTTKTFTTTATSGSVIFRTDSSGNNYYGVTVQVTPNY